MSFPQLQAFARSWMAHFEKQSVTATEAARRFLGRREYMSFWETQEMWDKLNEMWETDENRDVASSPPDIVDPDSEKLRATVLQYSALVARVFQANLEGLARARIEKHE